MAATLRPLSMSELLDQTFSLYRKNFVLFAGIIAIPQAAVLAMQLLIALLAAGGAGKAAMAVTGVLFLLVVLVVSIIGYSVAQAATVNAVSAVYLERPMSIGEAYARVRGKVGGVVNVVFSVGLRVAIGFLLLIVPGILWMLKYSLSVPALALEDLSANEAMDRSSDLTDGCRGSVFVIYFLFFVLTYVVIFAVTFPVVGFLTVAKVPQSSFIFQLGNDLSGFVATVIVTPFMTIALSLVYYDQRVRKEAFDLQLMMQTIDGTVAGAAAGGAGPQA